MSQQRCKETTKNITIMCSIGCTVVLPPQPQVLTARILERESVEATGTDDKWLLAHPQELYHLQTQPHPLTQSQFRHNMKQHYPYIETIVKISHDAGRLKRYYTHRKQLVYSQPQVAIYVLQIFAFFTDQNQILPESLPRDESFHAL